MNDPTVRALRASAAKSKAAQKAAEKQAEKKAKIKAKYAQNRKEKIQLNIKEALEWEKKAEHERRELVLKAWREGRAKLDEIKEALANGELGAEGVQLQNYA